MYLVMENRPCTSRLAKWEEMGEEGDLAWDQSQIKPGLLSAVPTPQGRFKGKP